MVSVGKTAETPPIAAQAAKPDPRKWTDATSESSSSAGSDPGSPRYGQFFYTKNLSFQAFSSRFSLFDTIKRAFAFWHLLKSF